jgi:hypothetical protein
MGFRFRAQKCPLLVKTRLCAAPKRLPGQSDRSDALRIEKHEDLHFGAREKVAMVTGPKGTEFDLSERCSVCGHYGEVFDLPGRFEKYCLECSADVATAILLTTEIDAATLAGRSTGELVTEFTCVHIRMLYRAQSANLENI